MRKSSQPYDQFIAFFIEEFMDELWYLKKSERGDIDKRKEADPWKALTQVAIGIVGQINPGAAAALLISKELANKLIDVAEKIYEAGKTAWEAYQEIKLPDTDKQLNSILSSHDGPVDMQAMRLLAELLGHGLVQRYEDCITHRLDLTNPPASLMPLARIGAKRCFGYMQSKAYEDDLEKISRSGDHKTPELLKQRAILMKGVFWGELDSGIIANTKRVISIRLPQLMKNSLEQHLPLSEDGKKLFNRQSSKKLRKFTPKDALTRPAWWAERESKIYMKTIGEKTKWIKNPEHTEEKNPLYGYAWIDQSTNAPEEKYSIFSESPRAYARGISCFELRSLSS